MATATLPDSSLASLDTLADLLDRVGNVPLERIRLHPFPGTATERDVLAAHGLPQKRLCELVDGILIEKPMGAKEALFAGWVLTHVNLFVLEHDLGVALGADGYLRLWPGRVRIPDVCFISWKQMPEGKFPDEPLAPLYADLVVEVLSKSNTPKEIALKLEDYFSSGTRLAWIIDPATESAEVYKSPRSCKHVERDGTLDGGRVLPGFKLSLAELFARTQRRRKS